MSRDGDRVATSSTDEHSAKCIKAVEDYRGRNIMKWKAIAQISSALESATASMNCHIPDFRTQYQEYIYDFTRFFHISMTPYKYLMTII